MAQPADPDDAHSLARSGAVLKQRFTCRDAAAQHGRRVLRGDLVGDLDHTAAVAPPVVGIASHRLAAVLPLGGICADVMRAVWCPVIGACLTVAIAVLACVRLCTDSDTVADLDALDLGPDADGVTYDLVAHADGVVCLTPARTKRVQIRSADATMCDLDVDIFSLE